MTINFANDTTTIVMNALASQDVQVKNMLYRAQAIETLIDYLKSHPEGACTRELNLAIVEGIGGQAAYHAPYAETLLAWFNKYNWVTSEIRTEETVEVTFDEFLDKWDTIDYNPDGTITVHWKDHTPKTLHNYTIVDTWYILGRQVYRVKGKYNVQVKRKYWIWKKA